MSTRQSFLRSRLLSIRFAVDGVRALVATQPNARIHLVATVLVIGAGLVLDVGRSDWIALTLAMALVWLAEALNTAVECLGDAITRELHPLIGRAKDVAAGGVLLAALGAAAIGCLVFAPHLFD